MMSFARSTILLVALIGLLLTTGCATHPATPGPLPPPTRLLTTEYFFGSPLSGPVAGVVPIVMPADALSVRVTFIALENPPSTPFPPAGSRAVFFSSTGGGSAVLPAAELTRDATIADLSDPGTIWATLQKSRAGRFVPLPTLTAAVPVGVTAQFSALDPESVIDPVTAIPTRRSVQILIFRPTDPAAPRQLALVVKDFVAEKESSNGLCTEIALFNLPPGVITSTVLTLPFRFDHADAKAIAIAIEIAPGSNDAAQLADLADCLKKATAAMPTTQATQPTGEANPWAAVTTAAQSLTPVLGRRSALAFLSDQTGAGLCEDLAMEADDAVLAQLVEDIQAKVNTRSTQQSYANVGWVLDQTALQLLAKKLDEAANGNEKFPGELRAILITRTGEVGRHSASLQDVLRGLTSRQDLDNRLLAQNTIFLEDSNPAARVRAYDWLNARHQAPAGYDPLANGKARREALEKAAGAP